MQVYGRKSVHRAHLQSRPPISQPCIASSPGAGGLPCDTKLRVFQPRNPRKARSTRVRWGMAWLKVFARLIKTTTATDDEVCVCEWYYAYPFSEEREPELRQQRVLETRSWHDPQQNDLSHSRELRKTSDGLNHPSG